MSDITVINTNVNHSDYGKAQVLGLDVQFSKMLGDVIVENYVKQLSEEDMNLIIKYMTGDLFEMMRDFSSEDPSAKKKIVRESWEEKDKQYSYRTNTIQSVGDKIRQMFNERVKEEMKVKIEEIVKTADYQTKINAMAQEIVDYVIEGYKEDLKKSIREKMIGNVMNNDQYYGGISLMSAINQAIDERILH